MPFTKPCLNEMQIYIFLLITPPDLTGSSELPFPAPAPPPIPREVEEGAGTGSDREELW